jgi:opacity protein-like surface antigen
MFPIGPYAAFGFAVDVSGSSLKTSSTQTTSKFVPLTGDIITETLSTTNNQPVTSTLRAKIGFVPVGMGLSNVMVFATAGGAVGKVSGSFNYYANNFATPPITPAIAVGSSSWDLTRFGYVVGGGLTVRYAFVSVTLEYLYTNLGTITENTPLTAFAATGCVPLAGTSCTSFAQTSIKTDTSAVRLKFGLPL